MTAVAPLPSDTSQSADTEVLREQIRLLFQHLPFVLIGNLVSSLGVVILFWHGGRHEILLGWTVAIYAFSALRYRFYRRFQRDSSHFDPRAWARHAVVMSAVSGALWGAIGVLLFQLDSTIVMAMVVVLGGMVAGSVSSHSCYLPVYLAYALLAIVPFVVRCFLDTELFFVTLGLLSATFLMVNIHYGKNLQKSIVKTIRVQFQNDALISALRQQKELAEQANLAKTRFLAAASHDLRQPVQAIELFADALERDLGSHPGRTLLSRIRHAGGALESLLNALLDFSKIDAATIVPEVRHFPLQETFDRLQAAFSDLAQARGLILRIAPTRTWVESDPALLERILRNFISNALKYTPSGKVLVGCRRAGHALRIEVHDTGIGIPEDAREDVFREFYQVDNPERDREKGLGLGLFIADGLARSLGHALRLQSVEGCGSSFSVTVPVGVQARATPPAPQTASSQDWLRDRTVLFIDDDAAIREGLAETLERWGCAVVAAESAAEALELMRASGFAPDALLVDYRLRDSETGVDAIRAVQRAWGLVPAAIMTGDTAPDRLREARAAGYPLLHKPLTAARIRALLMHLLATRREQNPAPPIPQP